MFVSRVGPPAMSDRVGPCLLILHLAAMLAENVGRDNGAEGVLRVMPSLRVIDRNRRGPASGSVAAAFLRPHGTDKGILWRAPAWRKRDDGQIGHSHEAA